jgi:urea transport system ATP-binding protein
MFEVSQLNVAYGESHVIHDISLTVGANESVAVMGRNGMGKTRLY